MSFLAIIGFGIAIYLADNLASFCFGFYRGFAESKGKAFTDKERAQLQAWEYVAEFICVVVAIALLANWQSPAILFAASALAVANMMSYILQRIFLKRVSKVYWRAVATSFLLCLPMGLSLASFIA